MPDRQHLKPLLLILSARVYGLLILYVLFLRTSVREGDLGFLYQDLGDFRANRRAAIQNSFWERLAPFDGQWYQDISVRGYRKLSEIELAQRDIPPGNFAFFPMLPGLLKVTRSLAPYHYLTLTILVVAYLSVLGCYLAMRIAETINAPPVLTMVLLLAFPTSVFQLLLYTEGIFLFCSSLSLYYTIKRRLVGAAVSAVLASLCRPQGMLLCLSIALEFLWPALRERPLRITRLVWSLCGTISPFFGYLVMATISWSVSDSPLAFLKIQSRWGRSYEAGGVFHALLSVWGYRGPPFDVFGLLLGVGLVPLLWRWLPRSLAAYGTSTVILPLLTGSILSLGRFLSVSVPHFLCLAILLDRSKTARSITVAAMIVAQILLAKGVIGWWFVG